MKKTITSYTFVLALLTQAFLSQTAFAANAENGRKILAEKNCAACHGQNFWQTTAPEYPRLAGQHKYYLYYSLMAYKKQGNGFGRDNAIMKGQAASLSSQDMADIAEYLSKLPTQFVLKK